MENDKKITGASFINGKIYLTSDEVPKDGDHYLCKDMDEVLHCGSLRRNMEIGWPGDNPVKIIFTDDEELIKNGIRKVNLNFPVTF